VAGGIAVFVVFCQLTGAADLIAAARSIPRRR
jgi:hypothetical protein